MEDPIVEMMADKTKEWFAYAVVGMIWADGRVDQAEIKYLKGILGFLKDKKLITSVLEMIKQNIMPELTPIKIDNDQAIAIMKHLTSLSIVDEELAKSEEIFLKDAAVHLGLSTALADKFLALARKRLGGNRFPASLLIGEDSVEVSCFGFTEDACMIFTDRLVNPLARLTLKLHTKPQADRQAGFYNPIIAEAQWCREVKSSVARYVVKAAMKRPISSEEGARLVFSLPEESAVKKTFEPDFSCLLGFFVSCRSCGNKDIPFWQLRTRSLHANNNIFGIPVYDRAFGDVDFCDYNLFQISVCPNCLFASNQIDYFQRQDKAVGVSLFDANSFKAKWQGGLGNRKKLVGKNDSWLFSGDRTLNQAIISYELAVHTHDQLGQLGDDEDYATHQRKSVSFMLTQAEMLMNKGERAIAEQILLKVKKRLEKAFPNMGREAGIRAAHLIVLISIYFKNLENVGDYLNYLNNYSRQYPVKAGTKESKLLNLAVRQTTEAWQSKDQWAYDSMRNFHLEN